MNILLPRLLAGFSDLVVGRESYEERAAKDLVYGPTLLWVLFKAHVDEATEVARPSVRDLWNFRINDDVAQLPSIPDFVERWHAGSKFVGKATKGVDVDFLLIVETLHDFRCTPMGCTFSGLAALSLLAESTGKPHVRDFDLSICREQDVVGL